MGDISGGGRVRVREVGKLKEKDKMYVRGD